MVIHEKYVQSHISCVYIHEVYTSNKHIFYVIKLYLLKIFIKSKNTVTLVLQINSNFCI